MIRSLGLPEAVTRCLEPSAALELRLSVARGAIPLAPAQRLCSLAILLTDPDPSVRTEARSAFDSLPEAFIGDALGDPDLPGAVVDTAAEICSDRPGVLCRALEHPALEPRTAERYLESADEEVLSRIAGNQRLLGGSPELARRLLENPRLHPAVRSRLASLYGEPEEAEVPLPDVDEVALPEALPVELLEDAAAAREGEGSQNLYQLVQSLSVSQKIKLAMLGSKGARRLLIRDPNKLVAAAVIRSPKIREDEVTAIAQERTIADEVIRVILNRKDWLKSYPLRLALCQNPKTPIPRALRLIETLQERDLRQISKSRNVQRAVAMGALRVLAKRGKV